NELGQVLNVRQKHAHSWAEAYIGVGPQHLPTWITLDPTPATERDRSIARVGGMMSTFRPLTDFMRYIWVFYIVGFIRERQDFLLYNPIRRIVERSTEGFRELGDLVSAEAKSLFFFDTRASFISVRGVFVSFTALFCLVGLLRGARWLWRRLL